MKNLKGKFLVAFCCLPLLLGNRVYAVSVAREKYDVLIKVNIDSVSYDRGHEVGGELLRAIEILEDGIHFEGTGDASLDAEIVYNRLFELFGEGGITYRLEEDIVDNVFDMDIRYSAGTLIGSSIVSTPKYCDPYQIYEIDTYNSSPYID